MNCLISEHETPPERSGSTRRVRFDDKGPQTREFERVDSRRKRKDSKRDREKGSSRKEALKPSQPFPTQVFTEVITGRGPRLARRFVEGLLVKVTVPGRRGQEIVAEDMALEIVGPAEDSPLFVAQRKLRSILKVKQIEYRHIILKQPTEAAQRQVYQHGLSDVVNELSFLHEIEPKKSEVYPKFSIEPNNLNVELLVGQPAEEKVAATKELPDFSQVSVAHSIKQHILGDLSSADETHLPSLSRFNSIESDFSDLQHSDEPEALDDKDLDGFEIAFCPYSSLPRPATPPPGLQI